MHNLQRHINLLTNMLCIFQIVFPGTLVPEILKAFLEPDFEIESCTGVSSGVEEAEGDAAIDAAAEEDGYTKGLLRDGT